MSKQIRFLFLFSKGMNCALSFALLYMLWACAQQVPLTGGDKDERPPQIIQELSTPNLQTNFKKQTIIIEFDEYIQLQNITQQLVISPPLTNFPKVNEKLKKLIFEFPEEEVLKEDATYSINFGDAVRDLTEGNPVPNFKYIFSTGAYIDSLKVEGRVVDALTGEAVKDVLYMLYSNRNDTVVRTEKPFYFGKTDQDGKFLIENVKAGTYKGFALEDQDLNYLYNIATERIGFSADSIVVSEDTTLQIYAAIFEPYSLITKPKVNKKQYGVVSLIFKRTPYDAEISVEDVGQNYFIETKEDTVKVWYHNLDSLDWNIYVQRDTITDTIFVEDTPKDLAKKKLQLDKIPRKAGKTINLNPVKPIRLSFNHPITAIDTSLILFSEDTLLVQSTATDSTEIIPSDSMEVDTTTVFPDSMVIDSVPPNYIQANFTIDSTEQRTAVISYAWKETLQYRLQLLPGAITDLYGLTNTDTIELTYLVKEKKDFGTIIFTASGMDSLQAYYFELLLANNVVESFTVQDATTYNRTFSGLPPGKYTIKVIEDLNRNGRWDSGNYDKKLQPENIATTDLEELKPNWDIEANITVEF